MKKSRKLMSILLIVAMLFTLAAPAMAADGDAGTTKPGSITITNAVVDQTYTAYRILDLESYDVETGAYAYKANSEWAEFLTGAGKEYVKIENGYVTWKAKESDAAAFAELAQKYAKENEIAAVATKTATSTTVAFDNLDLGYYLVDTTLGVLCSLNTTKPHVDMTEKNQAPSVTKKVQEDSNVGKTNEWGATNDADINQTVNYKATITVQKGAENYILHDTMSAGLTFDAKSVKVKVGGADVAAENYTVTAPGTCKCTFEVVFDNNYIAGLDAGTEIVVEYSATLNENAVVGLPGNPNEVQLQYGDINKPTYTPKQETTTYTWEMDVVKYTTKDGNEVMLAGATFKLCKDAVGENAIRFHNLDIKEDDAQDDNKYAVCVSTDCDKEHVGAITTDDTGTFHVEGLDADTYYLHETVAPNGYNKLAAPITVVIDSEGNVKTYNDENELVVVEKVRVLNQTGTELPDTGGIGTTIFYVVGGALVLGAAILLVTRRRMAE